LFQFVLTKIALLCGQQIETVAEIVAVNVLCSGLHTKIIHDANHFLLITVTPQQVQVQGVRFNLVRFLL